MRPSGPPFHDVSPMLGLEGSERPLDDLGRGVPGDGVVHLVLDRGVEVFGHGRVLVVVEAALLEDVGDLEPHATLARADVADTGEQLVEVVLAEWPAVLEHVVVEDEALGDVLLEGRRRPLTEAGRAHRVHSVPDSDYCIEVVVCFRSATFGGGFSGKTGKTS